MTKTLIYRFVSVVMLLTVGLFLGHVLCRHVRGASVHRHNHLSYAVEDDAISGKGVINSAYQEQAAAAADQFGTAVVHPSALRMKAREIIFSRLVSTILSLHFVYTQTTSSAT